MHHGLMAGRPHTKTSSSQQHPSITDTWPRPRGLCCAFPSPSTTTAGSSRHPGHRTREQGWLRSDPKVLQGSRRFCVWHRTTMPSHNDTSSVNMMCHQHTPRSNRSNRGESARIDAGCRCVCVAAGRVIRPGVAWPPLLAQVNAPDAHAARVTTRQGSRWQRPPAPASSDDH